MSTSLNRILKSMPLQIKTFPIGQESGSKSRTPWTIDLFRKTLRTPKRINRVHEVRSVVSREQRMLINSFCVQTKLKSELDRFHHQSQDSRPSWRSSILAEYIMFRPCHFFQFSFLTFSLLLKEFLLFE